MSSTFLSGASSDEFLAKKSSRPGNKKPSKQCRREFENMQNCIEDILDQNTKATNRWGQRLSRDNRNARICANRAFDDEDVWDCYSNVINRVARRCPVEVDAFKEKCNSPFEFEDFALDLAEELEDGKSLM